MADITTGTGADSPEDIGDDAALESIGVDPDAPVKQADANEPGQNEDEEEDGFEGDEDDEEDDDEDEDTKQASDETKTE